MKRCILLLLLFLLLSATPARAQQTYGLIWQSDWPIDPTSIAVDVWGGTLTSSTIAGDGKSGQVDVTAPRRCVVIRWQAETVAGIAIPPIRREWYGDCRVLLPLIGGGDGQ